MSAPEQGGLSEARMNPAEERDLKAAFERDKWADEWNSLPTAIDRLLATRLAAVPAADAELRAAVEGLADLSAAATPGPWEVQRGSIGPRDDKGTPWPMDYVAPGGTVPRFKVTTGEPDAALIVAAVNLVRSLLAGRGDV